MLHSLMPFITELHTKTYVSEDMFFSVYLMNRMYDAYDHYISCLPRWCWSNFSYRKKMCERPCVFFLFLKDGRAATSNLFEKVVTSFQNLSFLKSLKSPRFHSNIFEIKLLSTNILDVIILSIYMINFRIK